MSNKKHRLLLVCQKMGTLEDGKIVMAVGKDEHVFNLEENDKFFTALFAVDPFEDE